MTAHRNCSPDDVRNVWSTISHLNVTGKEATMEAIMLKAQESFGWSISDTSSRISDCVATNLVEIVETKSLLYQIGGVDSSGSFSQHDWYCFECQNAGKVIGCESCFRVYHESCVHPRAHVPEMSFVCDWCRVTLHRDYQDRECLKRALSQVLADALSKGGAHFSHLPESSWPYTERQYRLLVANHIDLEEMQRKIDLFSYNSDKEFLADLHLLRHNVIILYGTDNALATIATEMVISVKAALDAVDFNELKAYERPDCKAPLGTPGDKLPESHNGVENLVMREQSFKGQKREGCECEWEVLTMNELGGLQDGWRLLYENHREKMIIEFLGKLSKECDAERDRLRIDMINQFKAELESTKRELDKQYAQKLKNEVQTLMENHRFDVSQTKKTQWCAKCANEAIYHCCWNTSYCSVKCQHESWAVHKRTCRRRKAE
uniref:MYND-type domain-containing protein n=1 Tax=Trichuris muris TaxID=70415 RepID=A0A5S6QDY6_TRIMR